MNSTITVLAIYFAIFLPIFGMIYYTNNKKRKKYNELMNNLTVGQKVMTVGGIIGNITKIDEETVEIKVDQNSRLTLTKKAVSHILK
ncbi:preprotein translocase subunit YajC [Streptobacillus felis]|uniref:Preprotein translocase subunit YajC n=1 Tax=Streptobacillus felis TaxID=1384509 RepID=A0A7Z0PEN6_9FUSO|nr:preprotein translocase subunit YajC [Streptobacillus felis]NYV27333.1 preprotein translocase subunit YajC [Streptobacillus felis]